MATLVIEKKLETNRYSVTFKIADVSTAEGDLLADFGDPTITLTDTLRLSPQARTLTLSGITGTFVVGDTITGGTSSATALVEKVGSTSLEVVQLSGTLVNGETISTPTPASATISVAPVVATTAPFATTASSLVAIDPKFDLISIAPSSLRKIPSNFPFTKTWDASSETSTTAIDSTRIGYAKALANDYAAYVKYLVEAKWNAFISKVDDFTDTENVPL